jgi:hypothetical protein
MIKMLIEEPLAGSAKTPEAFKVLKLSWPDGERETLALGAFWTSTAEMPESPDGGLCIDPSAA